jgi:hypothetical protein
LLGLELTLSSDLAQVDLLLEQFAMDTELDSA